MLKTLQELIRSDKPVLICMTIVRYPISKDMIARMEKLKPEMNDRLNMIIVDLEQYPEIGESFSIRGIPTELLFRKGKELSRKAGLMTEAQLRKFIEQHLV
jgi:thioredoxin 1